MKIPALYQIERFIRRFIKRNCNEEKISLETLESISTNSYEYWDNRYLINENSGPGSYNHLAEFKAKVLNDFVAKENIQTVFEMGCGDGNQLKYAKYPLYLGTDVSKKAVSLCKSKFQTDTNKTFLCVNGGNHDNIYDFIKADMSISLDVLYHLVEDNIFEDYICSLFKTSKKWVVVYSSNYDDSSFSGEKFKHVRHRLFSKYIEENIKDFEFVEEIKNEFPQDTTANFYFYKKKGCE